ncbi:MAG: ABC transporter permease [Clostridia bacterium]|nr:ABC transporter permease [Clostridia bacterium]
MKTLLMLTGRNVKMYFKDKGMFFTSLITPLILIVLFLTFLGNIYRQNFLSIIPEGVEVPNALSEAFAGGFLFSALLSVCCVTVAFCSNLLVIQDKVTGARRDIIMTPVKGSTLALSYFLSTAFTTLIICMTALCVGFLYLGKVGWYLSASDVILCVCDVVLLTFFGTALSSVVNYPLSTQGQASAVGTIVSSMYGFISGAYMPISQFSSGIKTFISCLPGTYGTILLHRHFINGVMRELEGEYVPDIIVDEFRAAFDMRAELFGHELNDVHMYLILGGATLFLIILYVILNLFKKNKKNRIKG